MRPAVSSLQLPHTTPLQRHIPRTTRHTTHAHRATGGTAEDRNSRSCLAADIWHNLSVVMFARGQVRHNASFIVCVWAGERGRVLFVSWRLVGMDRLRYESNETERGSAGVQAVVTPTRSSRARVSDKMARADAGLAAPRRRGRHGTPCALPFVSAHTSSVCQISPSCHNSCPSI